MSTDGVICIIAWALLVCFVAFFVAGDWLNWRDRRVRRQRGFDVLPRNKGDDRDG